MHNEFEVLCFITHTKKKVLWNYFNMKVVFTLGFPDGYLPLSKNLPAVQETPVQFPGWEDPLEKG